MYKISTNVIMYFPLPHISPHVPRTTSPRSVISQCFGLLLMCNCILFHDTSLDMLVDCLYPKYKAPKTKRVITYF